MSRLTLVTLLFSTLLAGPALSAELTGRVVDADGRPLPGAVINLTAPGWKLRLIVGELGAFAAPLPEPSPSRIEATVTAPGFRPRTVVVENPSLPVEIALAEQRLFSGEVDVTAVRARVGETPVTVSNISREEIERQYWGQDVPMLLTRAPGFYAYNDSGNGIGYSYFFVRGFDMRRTAVSLNGVPLNDAHSHSVFFIDLADFLATTGDVQLQRGVGTNLYGGTAIGGSVDLRTRTPLTEPRLRLDTTFGSWGTERHALEYDSGLMDGAWAATFRYSRIDSEGYRDQSWVEMWNYHLAIEHYGDASTTRITLFGGPERTHLAYEGIPRAALDGEISGDRRRDRRLNPLDYSNEVDEFFQPHYQLEHTWQVDDRLALQNTLFYFEGDGFFEQFKSDRWMPEYDLEPFPGADGELVETTDLVRRRQVDEWDAGWIPSVEWRHGRGVLQAGALVRLHSGRHWGETVWAASYPPGLPPNHPYYDYELDKTSLQPFVQETWTPHPDWTVLAGLTWTHHEYDLHDDRLGGVEYQPSFSYLLPRLGATWRPAPGWSVFANVSRGGREPAFRDLYDPQDYWFGEPLDLEPEELTDFELGASRTWSTGHASANVYHLDFDNAIVWAGGLDNNGVPTNANGAVTSHHGVELEAAWTPRPRWGGRVTAAYTEATFDDFVEYDFEGGATDHSGNAVAGVPDWLATLELTGGIGPVDLLLTVRHVGRFYLDNTEDLRKDPEQRRQAGYVQRVNDAFTTLDLAAEASLGRAVAELLQADDVRLRLRVDNLSDELYTTFGYFDGVEPVWIPAATRSAYLGVRVDW